MEPLVSKPPVASMDWIQLGRLFALQNILVGSVDDRFACRHPPLLLHAPLLPHLHPPTHTNVLCYIHRPSIPLQLPILTSSSNLPPAVQPLFKWIFYSLLMFLCSFLYAIIFQRSKADECVISPFWFRPHEAHVLVQSEMIQISRIIPYSPTNVN